MRKSHCGPVQDAVVGKLLQVSSQVMRKSHAPSAAPSAADSGLGVALRRPFEPVLQLGTSDQSGGSAQAKRKVFVSPVPREAQGCQAVGLKLPTHYLSSTKSKDRELPVNYFVVLYTKQANKVGDGGMFVQQDLSVDSVAAEATVFRAATQK